MPRKHRGVALAVGLATVGALFAFPSPEAQAQEWTCSGAAIRVILGGNELAPANANGAANAPPQKCVDSSAGVPPQPFDTNSALPQLSPALRIVAQALFAGTSISPDAPPTNAQAIGAAASLEGSPPPPLPAEPPTIRIGGEALRISTGVTQSFAVGACATGGVPTYFSNGQILDIRVNGTPVPLDGLVTQVANGITNSPLAPLVSIFPLELVTTGDATSASQTHTRRALRISIAGGQIQAILGESRVGRNGDVCAGTPPGPGCPAGSVLDPTTGLCLRAIEVPGFPNCPLGTFPANNTCFAIIATSGGPIGGSLVPTSQFPGFRTSRCAKDRRWRGAKFVIVGTPRSDKITGTNGDDVIFGLGGNDRIAGGRGKDCLIGGTGRDHLDGESNSDLLDGNTARDTLNGGSKADHLYGGKSHDAMNGGTGNDQLFGESGRDKMVGGSGNDTLTGGPDRDYIDDGQGRDRVFGGKGPDFINLAIGGVPALVINCGSGKDIVRFNPNERRRVNSNCEVRKGGP